MSITLALAYYGLLSLLLVGTTIMYTYATQGFAYGFSSNRVAPELSPFAIRLNRVWLNQVESSAYILPALLAAQFAGLSGGGVELAALLIVIGRAAFAALYLSGISFIRVPAFVLGTVSSLYLGVLVVIGG